MTETERVERLSSILEAALAGNFSADFDFCSGDPAYERLAQSIKELLANQKDFVTETQVTSSRIISASEDLSLTLEENSAFMAQLYESSKSISSLNNKNFHETSEAIGTIREIVANIDRVRDFSNGAQQVSDTAEEVIAQGMERIYAIIALIGEIEQGTKRTVEYMDQFSESTKEISKILKGVHDISRETEILSFNASIESKRAGVEGKGFGVIAGAIRDLAEKSRSEVTEIGNVVERIDAGLKTLTDNIHDDNSRVGQSVGHTKTIEESLSRMREAFSQLSAQIEGIRSASDAQSELAAGISSKISDVEDNARQVSDGFGGVYASVEKQKNSMDALNSLGKYLLGAAGEMADIVRGAGCGTVDGEQIAASAAAVFELLERDVLSEPSFATLDPEKHRQLLDALLAGGTVEAAWSNDNKGRFIYSNPPAGIKNAKVRAWFKESIAGKTYTSDVYISAITKEPCITVSVPIVRDGAVIGVLGADLRVG